VGHPEIATIDARRTAEACLPLEARIKAQAFVLGFDLAGLTALGPAETGDAFLDWIGHGYAGGMSYLERGAELRRDTRRPTAGVSTAIVVAMNYGGTQAPGPIARYARGRDYHDVVKERLDALHAWLDCAVGAAVAGRSYVDTGPILERDLARKAGLGWFGKNTNLINPGLGSFFFIGALLVDLDLTPDAPFAADRCGSCTRCLDACPTDAFVAPRVLDATRCISYLTIEHRGAIDDALRPLIGELVYGCDICQDVCPWNVRFSRNVRVPDLAPAGHVGDADPVGLLQLSDDQFRARFRGTAMTRAKRRGLARNAAIALGNRGRPEDAAALARAAASDEDPVVREHAAWALARCGGAGTAPEPPTSDH
jgi:epoxyqueuosine reductase